MRGKFEDLTKRHFGRLTVLGRDASKDSKRGAFWICRCECGKIKSIAAASLKSGATQSCGCLNKEILSSQKNIQGMVGQRFGKLVVLNRAGTYVSPQGQKKPIWHCACDCGNETTVVSQDLKSGHTTSCGCAPKKQRGDGLIDLIGKRFGELVVLERAQDYQYCCSNGKETTSPSWLCRCDCGNKVIVQGGNLRNGVSTNCGCKKVSSKGENAVADFLIANNIRHAREYSFDELRNQSGNLLRFDFAILNDDDTVIILVEYQGEQHYVDRTSFGKYQRMFSDRLKKEYCSMNHIPLHEIRFDEDFDNACSVLLNRIRHLEQPKQK